MAARKAGGKQVIRASGKKPVTFTKGGLHKSLGVPQGQPIPPSKMNAAAAGNYGPLAKKQAGMAKGMLAAGRKTASRNRKRGK